MDRQTVTQSTQLSLVRLASLLSLIYRYKPQRAAHPDQIKEDGLINNISITFTLVLFVFQVPSNQKSQRFSALPCDQKHYKMWKKGDMTAGNKAMAVSGQVILRLRGEYQNPVGYYLVTSMPHLYPL